MINKSEDFSILSKFSMSSKLILNSTEFEYNIMNRIGELSNLHRKLRDGVELPKEVTMTDIYGTKLTKKGKDITIAKVNIYMKKALNAALEIGLETKLPIIKKFCPLYELEKISIVDTLINTE